MCIYFNCRATKKPKITKNDSSGSSSDRSGSSSGDSDQDDKEVAKIMET